MPSIKDYVISGFNLGNLRTQDYKVPENDLKTTKPVFTAPILEENVVNFAGNGEMQISQLGTAVFADIQLLDPESDLGLYLDTVLFDVSMSKNIVTTSIQGRSGTVKEYIADGDYLVSMRGALVNSLGQQYPEQSMKTLIELCQLPYALNITCPYLQQFNIYSLVIQDYSLPQREGFQNTQFFSLECLSDEPIELIINA